MSCIITTPQNRRQALGFGLVGARAREKKPFIHHIQPCYLPHTGRGKKRRGQERERERERERKWGREVTMNTKPDQQQKILDPIQDFYASTIIGTRLVKIATGSRNMRTE